LVPTSFGPCCEKNCASAGCGEKSSVAAIRADGKALKNPGEIAVEIRRPAPAGFNMRTKNFRAPCRMITPHVANGFEPQIAARNTTALNISSLAHGRFTGPPLDP